MEKCPYCGKEMAEGIIQSAHEISWLPEYKRRVFSRAEFHKGGAVLGKLSMIHGSSVRAFRCADCKKVIIVEEWE